MIPARASSRCSFVPTDPIKRAATSETGGGLYRPIAVRALTAARENNRRAPFSLAAGASCALGFSARALSLGEEGHGQLDTMGAACRAAQRVQPVKFDGLAIFRERRVFDSNQTGPENRRRRLEVARLRSFFVAGRVAASR